MFSSGSSSYQFTPIPKTPSRTLGFSNYQTGPINNTRYNPYYNQRQSTYTNNYPQQSKEPSCILVSGISDNDSYLYNYFANFGDIELYNKNIKNSCMIIKYKDPNSLRRAMNGWNKDYSRFNGVSIRIIDEEQQNSIIQQSEGENMLYNEYGANEEKYYAGASMGNYGYSEKKTKWEKFLDVFLNL